jgi:NADH-ubiquinone oxidoreductase chain 3
LLFGDFTILDADLCGEPYDGKLSRTVRRAVVTITLTHTFILYLMNNLIFIFIFIPFLAAILLALNVLLAPHKPDEAKVSQYECGFSAIPGQTRSTFQIHFMIVALLFLIFDLEILLLFPLAVTLYQVSTFGFTIGIIFFIVLTIGFVLEIGSGAIALNNFDHLQEGGKPPL